MPAKRTVTVGERTVEVRELTFGEVRDWMTEVETGSGDDPLHALALEDCSLSDLVHMADIDIAALEACTPSDLVELIQACKDLNPHFFRVRAAHASVARLMLREAEAMHSTVMPASS